MCCRVFIYKMIVGIFLHLIEMKIKPFLFLPISVKDLEGVNQLRSQYTSGLDRKDR